MKNRRSTPLAQLSDIDLRLLRVFRTVVECGGFSVAESVLGIGRSAISQQMSDLEQRLGLRLCQRGRAGFAMTEDGREVYQAALQLFSALENFRTEVNGLHQHLRGELNIGLTDNLVTMPHMRVTHALAGLKTRGPDVRIQISMSAPGQVEQGVLDGRLRVRLGGVEIVQPRFVMRVCDGLRGLVGQTGLEPHHLDEFRVGGADWVAFDDRDDRGRHAVRATSRRRRRADRGELTNTGV